MSAVNYLNPTQIEELNQKWQTIVAPHVWKTYRDEPPEASESVKKAYKLGELVAKVRKLQSQGFKVCLFIGRVPLEKLPSHYKEAKANEVWVSGDICLDSPEKAENLEASELQQRIHCWFDYNKQEGLDLIKGLFDKVVIDGSTTKCLCNDFAKRFGLLLHTPESELIFLNPCSLAQMLLPPEEPLKEEFDFDIGHYQLRTMFDPTYMALNEKLTNNYFTEYTNANTPEQIQSDKKVYSEEFYDLPENVNFENNFKTWIAKRAKKDGEFWMCDEAAVRLKSYLGNIYHHVEEHKNANYPYTTNHTVNKNEDHYFVVRHLKS